MKLKMYEEGGMVTCELAKHVKTVQQLIHTMCVEMIVFCNNQEEIGITLEKLQQIEKINCVKNEIVSIMVDIKQVLK